MEDKNMNYENDVAQTLDTGSTDEVAQEVVEATESVQMGDEAEQSAPQIEITGDVEEFGVDAQMVESQADTPPAEFDFSSEPSNIGEGFASPYNPIRYTDIKPVEEPEKVSRGIKVFALLLAIVIVITAASAAGYFLGKRQVEEKYIGNNVVVGLDAKPADTEELTAAQVYEKVNPSVVGICVYNAESKMANASGVFYSEDGYIITNDHIYSEIASPKFKIYTHDGNQYEAVYVAGDKVSDLAVLKIKEKAGNFQKATFGNSDQLIFGENVVAIGRPNGAENDSNITKGIISATSCRVQTTSRYSARLIETDSPINPGSSGGALVNMYGQIIGITSSKLASADIDAVGYAIPTTTMKRIVEELIKHGKVVTRAKLGITYDVIDSVYAEIKNLPNVGLYVSSVSEDSDLYQKVKKGDIITKINGIAVTSDEIVLDIIERAKAGDKVKVTFITSSNSEKTIEVILKANIGESSYHTKASNQGNLPQLPEKESDENGGVFDFPFGE